MKKKTVLIIACIVSLVFGFAGCGTSTFGMVVNDELNIEITAENADEDMTSSTGTFTVGEGDDVHIEPNFQEGEVLVEFYPVAAEDVNADVEEMMPEGEPEFEVEVSGTEPIECGFAAGDYMVKATVLEKANGTAVISLITQEEKDPWTKVSSAAEAAKGAGNMEDFEVPQDLQINDLTFSDPADYDRLSQGDRLALSNVFAGMDSGEITLTDETTGETFALTCAFTERQKAILKAGGLLPYTKEENDK